MSQWGAEAIQSFKLVLEYLGDAIAFDIYFVGQFSQNSFASAGGPAEVSGDIYQLCAMQYYPHYSRYMPFLYCMARTRAMIPANAANCSKAHLMDLELLRVRDPSRARLATFTAHPLFHMCRTATRMERE